MKDRGLTWAEIAQVKTCTKPAACNLYPSVTEFANDACATYQKKNTRLAIGKSDF